MAKKKFLSSNIGIAICALGTGADGDIQLLPAGTFNAPRGAMMGGGPWLLDDATAAALIQRITQRANDIPVDYEHQTLAASENGKPAPAAGWLNPRNFEWRPGDGLYVKAPDWTETAAAHIQKREYRYLSPVFSYSKKTGHVLDILHVGLTNSPAIDGMEDVLLAAAKSLSQQPEEPVMEKLLKMLGLSAEASEDEAVAALTAIQTTADDLKKDLKAKDEAIAAAKANGDATAMEAITGLQTEVAALTKSINEGEMDTLIAAAKTDGKLIPAQEKWARGLGLDALKGYLDVAHPIAALTQQQSKIQQRDAEGKAILTDEQIAVCTQMGISQEDFIKSLAQEA
jgi:phage I-like protein